MRKAAGDTQVTLSMWVSCRAQDTESTQGTYTSYFVKIAVREDDIVYNGWSGA